MTICLQNAKKKFFWISFVPSIDCLSEWTLQIPVCWYPWALTCQAARLERHTLLPLKIALQRERKMANFTWCSLAAQEIWSQNCCQDLPRRASRGKKENLGQREKNKAKEEWSKRQESRAEWEQFFYQAWNTRLSIGHYMLFARIYWEGQGPKESQKEEVGFFACPKL